MEAAWLLAALLTVKTVNRILASHGLSIPVTPVIVIRFRHRRSHLGGRTGVHQPVCVVASPRRHPSPQSAVSIMPALTPRHRRFPPTVWTQHQHRPLGFPNHPTRLSRFCLLPPVLPRAFQATFGWYGDPAGRPEIRVTAPARCRPRLMKRRRHQYFTHPRQVWCLHGVNGPLSRVL